mmetsp:Transcript_84637/g.152632  ORF Transcript_84637/g.152632 Transcript_84637/m.152632 type:complete len:290 (-) Transcript_84637:298-1167(-)
MSFTSWTAKMSIFFSSGASSFFVGFGAALKIFCLDCHSKNCFVQAACFSLKLGEGCRSVMQEVRLVSRTQFLRYSLLFAAGCHSYLTSSKPSSLSGIVKLEKDLLKTAGAKSPQPSFGRKESCFSSSVSSTFGGSLPKPSSSSSSSSSSSFTSSLTSSSLTSTSILDSSSSFFSSALCSAFLFASCCFLMASSACFFRCSSAFRRISAISFCRFAKAFSLSFSAFFSLHSWSAFSCFTFKALTCNILLCSGFGSPIMTWATVLKCGALNLFSTSARSAATKLDFTSITT